jgi:hypothetical protein
MNKLTFERLITEELERQGVRLGKLKVTHNRVRLLSYRRTQSGIALRVSDRLFAVGMPLIGIISNYLNGEASGERALKAAIAQLPSARPPSQRRFTLVHQGVFFRLDTLLKDEIEASGLDGDGVRITWGYRCSVRRGQRSIRLGSYRPDHDLIRIHRILDQSSVPEEVVRFIIFHELLHRKHGRLTTWTPHHSSAFRSEEKKHVAYDLTQRWLDTQLPLILRKAWSDPT